MKKYLVLIVLLGVAYYYYQQGSLPGLNFHMGGPTLEPLTTSAAHDFSAVSAILQQDMNNIPASLNGAAPRPTHAFDVKRRVLPHVGERVEYQTLRDVCDLIIGADAERSSLQQSNQSQQTRTTFHSVLDPVDKTHKPTPGPTVDQAAIHQRVEGIWNDHRARAASEVDRLLDSLKGKTV